MESLDLVYNALTKLEKNYSRSSKSRSEYITEKLGGDINIGSFLILHALSRETLTSQEDIDKMSTVRNILDSIRDRQSVLDNLSSFDFSTEAATFEAIMDSLSSAEFCGTGIRTVSQQSIWRSKADASHCYVTPTTSELVPMDTAPYFHCYNDAMAAIGGVMMGSPQNVGTILERSSGGSYKKVRRPKWWVNGKSR